MPLANNLLEDDLKEKILPIIEHRIPWLIIGLIGGIITTLISSRFEHLLTANISLVFFIPIIMYMADAVGTQTETIFIRSLSKEKVGLKDYFIKELLTGVALGVLFGFLLGIFAYLWLGSLTTALSVGLAMFANLTIAPIMALIVPLLLQKEKTDPALASGPFISVIQGLINLLVYFLIATLIIF